MLTLLTILVPTHDRPKEVRTALRSLNKIQLPFKVIINCDDKSIDESILKEFPKLNITFYRKKLWNWGEVYNFLISKVQTEYFYFLEDDDTINTSFDFLESNGPDYYFGYYNPHKRENTNIIKIRKWFQKLIGSTHTEIFEMNPEPKDFIHFQLGQLVFKKEKIKEVPITNDKYNDYYLFKDNPGTVICLDKVLYSQGLSHYSIS